ncbi:hypothetical protein Q31a_40800 [Aureliella helgolandensis]|uniref:Uncharacterized protein n=1 Tax=Aureliella helgolandensis TaxID=2527968 RepID=A0A518GB11_9BACT|nr:hypothetical protein Q31a_40800 [Aureliella helgolandensis]
MCGFLSKRELWECHEFGLLSDASAWLRICPCLLEFYEISHHAKTFCFENLQAFDIPP